MDDEKPASLRGRLLQVFWIVLIFVLVIYPLSIGPISYYAQVRYWPFRSPLWYRKFYAPLFWAIKNIPLVERVVIWDVDFWIKLEEKRDAREAAERDQLRSPEP